MKAIILAAGTSTRLRPLTDDLPKCLLPLNKDAIIDHQIKCLARFAVDHVFVVAGHKRVLLEEHIANVETGLPISIVNNERFEETDNAFSLSLALDHIDAGNDTVLVLDGDILFELALLKELIESPYDNACIIDNSKDIQPEDCKVVVTTIPPHVSASEYRATCLYEHDQTQCRLPESVHSCTQRAEYST